ncbi:MAG: hypothetical protein ACFFG0_17530 [Candidatus Thorarchaeota archaeon]
MTLIIEDFNKFEETSYQEFETTIKNDAFISGFQAAFNLNAARGKLLNLFEKQRREKIDDYEENEIKDLLNSIAADFNQFSFQNVGEIMESITRLVDNGQYQKALFQVIELTEPRDTVELVPL